MPEIIYYNIVNYHKEICKNDIPVDIYQLQDIAGCEVSLEEYKAKLSDKHITYLKLCDYQQIGNEPIVHIDDEMKKQYPWEELAESIKKIGVIVPLITLRYKEKEKEKFYYVTIEGKHRAFAAGLIKPFNPDLLLPNLIVEEDIEYTLMMRNKNYEKII